MRIQDIMTPNVEFVWPDDTLQEAALKMKDREIGPLPVWDGDRIVGMVTDRDIAVRGVALGCDPQTTAVRDVMTHEVIQCYEDEPADEAARLMQTRQVRRILVVNREELLVGILSLADLAADGGDPERAGRVLQDVSEPAMPRR